MRLSKLQVTTKEALKQRERAKGARQGKKEEKERKKEGKEEQTKREREKKKKEGRKEQGKGPKGPKGRKGRRKKERTTENQNIIISKCQNITCQVRNFRHHTIYKHKQPVTQKSQLILVDIHENNSHICSKLKVQNFWKITFSITAKKINRSEKHEQHF